VIWPPEIISAGPAQSRYVQLLTIIHSVTNGSSQLLHDWVSVETDELPNLGSRSIWHLNSHFGYSSMDHAHPVWIRSVVSGLCNMFICRFI
jgi:hypothetical protein